MIEFAAFVFLVITAPIWLTIAAYLIVWAAMIGGAIAAVWALFYGLTHHPAETGILLAVMAIAYGSVKLQAAIITSDWYIQREAVKQARRDARRQRWEQRGRNFAQWLKG